MRRAIALLALGLALVPAPAAASFPGRNGLIAFSSNRSGQWYDIYLMTDSGRVVKRLTRTVAVNEHSPAWSADGRRIAYVRRDWHDESHPGRWEIWTMKADGTARRPLAHGLDPAWSPDGRWIAFTGDYTPRSSRPDIWIMRSDGSDRRRLTVNRWASDREPDWSPNGRRIAYMTNVEGRASGRSAIWTMRPDGSDKRRITPLGAFTRAPSWSPDGRQIAFKRAATPGGLPVLWTMNTGGSGAAPRTSQAIGSCSWAPDGTRIACDTGSTTFLSDIFSFNLATAAVTSLLTSPKDDASPDWQPRAS